MTIFGQQVNTDTIIAVFVGSSSAIAYSHTPVLSMDFFTINPAGFCLKMITTLFFGAIGALGGIIAKELWKAAWPFLLERLKEKVKNYKIKK